MNHPIKQALKDASPVMLGYFPISMAFGILSKGAGLSMIEGVMMSAVVYAGASQFMAVSMIAAGISPMSIVLATFLMNFRHFIMSASIRARLKKTSKAYFPIIGFFLTDESFSVASIQEEIDHPAYLIPLEVACYSSWVSGTAAGFLAGAFFPPVLVQAMGIALYALFVALLIPSWKKSKEAIVLSMSAASVNMVLVKVLGWSGSASFAVTVIVVSLLGAWVTTRSEKEAVHE